MPPAGRIDDSPAIGNGIEQPQWASGRSPSSYGARNIFVAAMALRRRKAHSASMDTTKSINSYINYGFWALGVISALAITVAVLVSR
jgi:hypothetical protein